MKHLLPIVLLFVSFRLFGQVPMEGTKTSTTKRLQTEIEKSKPDFDSIKLYIHNGAPIDTRDRYGRTVLHIAAFCHRTDIVFWLLNKGMNANDADNRFLETPLHLVTRKLEQNHITNENNRFELVRLLLEWGANLNPKDIYKRTPLMNEAPNRKGCQNSNWTREKSVDKCCQVRSSEYHKIPGGTWSGY